MKKIQTLLILLVFILSFITPTFSNASVNFPDVPNDFWAKKEIEFLTDSKIITGYQNGNYGPNDDVKRIQAAVMISRALKLDLNNRPNPGFKDIPTDYYAYKEIAAVVDEGYFLKGENFKPFEPLKRSDMAIALVEAFNLKGKYYGTINGVDNKYSSYVNILAANKITNIYEDGTYKPNNTVKRAHFAVFFARVLDDKFIDGSKDLEVCFIDVGQGDSTLLKTRNGKTILIDGGKKSAGEKVVSFLKNAGVTTLDLVVSTHPDEDHIGGLIDVLNNFTVKKVLDSGKEHTSQTYLDYLALIDEKNIIFEVAKEGSDVSIDSELKIKVLNSGSAGEDNNESSVVLKVSYGSVDFLLTGDAEIKQESEMVQKYDVSAEILKAGHHGSATSTSQVFVDEVKPKTAILSYGQDNSYGHPTSEVVTRLNSLGSDIYATASTGNTCVTTNGKVYSVVANPLEVNTTPNPPTENKSEIDLVSINLETEIVTIKNAGKSDVDMTGWELISVEGNQTYEFPANYILKAGAMVYISSGRDAKEQSPNYLKWTGSYIWNNDGDSAELYNAGGVKVDEIR